MNLLVNFRVQEIVYCLFSMARSLGALEELRTAGLAQTGIKSIIGGINV